MSPDDSAEKPRAESYIHDYSGLATKQSMRARTASNSATFLLPHLRPGQKLLDIGSGQGTITVGLAQAVSPGEVVGLDMEESQVTAARDHATQQGVSNARFVVMDAYHLEFDNNTFDAVYSNAVLTHLAKPVDVLEEAFRVLKPGGVIGVREIDMDSLIFYPEDPLLKANLEILKKYRKQSGGNPTIGRRLKALLREGGFENTWASGSCSSPSGTSEDVKARNEALVPELTGPRIREVARQLGWADDAQFDGYEQAIRAWAEHPDAFMIWFDCEAIGWKS